MHRPHLYGGRYTGDGCTSRMVNYNHDYQRQGEGCRVIMRAVQVLQVQDGLVLRRRLQLYRSLGRELV